MKKITYRLVYNRKKSLNRFGTAHLQVEAYLEKRKVYFSTHIYLNPKQWDNNRKMIVQHPHAEALNYRVREFMISLEEKELNLWKNARPITLAGLKKEFKAPASTSFIKFVQNDIDASQAKESTKQNRRTTLNLLTKFKRQVDFKEINVGFVYDFEKFLFSNGFKVNTVAKHMKHLKSFVNAAIDKAYIDSNDYPFRRYRIKSCEGKHAFLLPEELERLERFELPARYISLSQTLDAFLFCCYTGLRYSDFTHLSEKNITYIEGYPWIILRTIKTGAEVKLPVGLLFEGKAWKLIRKYQNHLTEFFQLKPNPTANKELIRIGKLAGIKKHFSFHSARHTNATLLIHKGANITTVQKLLGHRNVATTQIYSEIFEGTIINDLKKCQTVNKDDILEAKNELSAFR